MENSTLDKKQKNKKTFLKFLPWILVAILLIGNGVQFYLMNFKNKKSSVAETKCESFTKSYSDFMERYVDEELSEKMLEMRNGINSVNDFQNDPTCFYMYTMLNFKLGDYQDVIANTSKIKQMLKDNKVIDYSLIQVDNLDKVNTAALYLHQMELNSATSTGVKAE